MCGKAKLRDGLGRKVTCLQACHGLLLAEAEGDILPDRQRIEQRAELEGHAEPAPHCLELVAAGMDHFLAIDPDRPAIGAQQPQQAFQRDRLAASGRADDGKRLLRRDLDVDAAKHLLVAKGFGDAAHYDFWSCCL